MKKKRNIILAVNLVIILFEIIGIPDDLSFGILVYYTNLSNFIAIFACAVLCISLFLGEGAYKKALWVKYLAVCMTTVTIIVVMVILVPMQGLHMMYSDNFLYYHLICPVLMLISFLFIDGGRIPLSKAWIGMMPTVVYGIAAIIANCAGVLTGPYPFLMIRSQPIYMTVLWLVLIFGIAFAISWTLLRFRKNEE